MKKLRLFVPFFSLLVSVVCAYPCAAQNNKQPKQPKLKKNYFIKQYPQEFASVQCGLQDKAGNMWFGTGADGIYYYDGRTFTNFTRVDGLCHNDMLCCMEDKAGNIWFGTRNGVIRYTPSSGRPGKTDFISFLISANTIDITTHIKESYSYLAADNFVWSIFQDKAGKIWFGTNKGPYIYDLTTNPNNDTPQFTRFLDDGHIANKDNVHLKDITSMVEDGKGNIWFASGYAKEDGICRFDGRTITSYKPDGINSFRTIIAGKNGDLFFLNSFRGVYRYDGKTFTNFTEKIGIKHDTLIAFIEDRAGNFWFGAASDNMLHGGKGGVYRYDGHAIRKFTTKDGLSHNCVFWIFEDRKRNIWFGTRNTGLCRYDGRSFTDYTD